MSVFLLSMMMSLHATIVYEVDPQTSGTDQHQIKRYLLAARDAAEPVEIRIPAGTYLVGSSVLPVFSNTTIIMDKGCTLDFTGRDGGGLIRGYHMDGAVECRGGSTCTHSGYERVCNVHIRGGSIVLDPRYTSTVFEFSHASDITVENVNVHGGVRGLTFASCRSVSVSGCTCADIRFTDDVTGQICSNKVAGSTGHGIWVCGSNECEIRGNEVGSVAKCAVSIENSAQGQFADNVLVGGTHGLYLTGSSKWRISGNRADAGSADRHALYLGDYTTDCIIKDNTLGLGGFEESRVGTHGNVFPIQTEFDVISDGYAVGDGVTDDTAAFKKCLRKAMDAKSNISVTVPAGKYKLTSQLVVYPNTHLRISSDATLDIAARTGGTILAFHHFDESGVECNGGSECMHGYAAGVSNVVVEGGTWVRNSANGAAFADCRCMRGIAFRNVKTTGGACRGVEFTNCRGVEVLGCAFPEIRLDDADALIENCNLERSSNYGIQARNCQKVIIRGNEIENESKDGIFAMECGETLISGNKIRNTGGYGIQVKGVADKPVTAEIRDNDVDTKNTERYDVFLGDYCQGCKVLNNRLGVGGFWMSVVGVSDVKYEGWDPGTDKPVLRVTVTDYGTDIDSINRALRLANGYRRGGVEVVFPAGEYVCDNMLNVFPNTVITLEPGAKVVGAMPAGTLVKGRHLDALGMICTSDATCRHGGYTQTHDVIIQGGLWDRGGFGEQETIVFTFAHSRNITIRNAELRGASGHFVNVSGSSDVLVDNVVFRDAVADRTKDEHSMSLIEALHADFVDMVGEPTTYPVDNTAPNRLTVRNCVFDNVYAGVGTHHCPSGCEARDISVSNCIFNRLFSRCVAVYGYANAIAEHCRYSGCGEFATIWSGSLSKNDNQESCMVSVAFDGNGGIPQWNNRLYAAGVPFGVLPQATHAEEILRGWDSPNGTVTAATIVPACARMTLTAIWNDPAYSVRFEKNDGSGTSWSRTARMNEVFPLPFAGAGLNWSCSGRRFAGWQRVDGGRRYDEGVLCYNLCNGGGEVVFVAIWE